jgi:putative transposase
MSYIKIMVHCVWGTKNREAILTPEKRVQIFGHIRENAKKKEIYIDTIGGYLEHVHCLISLGGDQSISKVMQLIKGEASYWANQNKLFRYNFEWAEDFFAASVSESALKKVRNYILNQEEHHRKMTFTQEYEKFIDRYGFKLG